VLAADRDHDLELFVRAEPVDDEVRLTIERWVARPMAPPRLALVGTVDDDERRAAERTTFIFDVDANLNLIDVSPALATLLGVDHSAALGRPLTSLFRLIEESDGSMPLLAAVATRAAVDGQRAVSRHSQGAELIIDADPSLDDQGRFAGFHARIRREGDSDGADRDAPVFEESLDEALRSPLARIISAADHIVERGDGPLRSDYADYASDIAAVGSAADALIAFEDALLVGGGDSRSVVGDRHAAFAVRLVEQHRDGRAVGRVADCIAEHVDEDLDDGVGLAGGRARRV